MGAVFVRTEGNIGIFGIFLWVCVCVCGAWTHACMYTHVCARVEARGKSQKFCFVFLYPCLWGRVSELELGWWPENPNKPQPLYPHSAGVIDLLLGELGNLNTAPLAWAARPLTHWHIFSATCRSFLLITNSCIFKKFLVIHIYFMKILDLKIMAFLIF